MQVLLLCRFYKEGKFQLIKITEIIINGNQIIIFKIIIKYYKEINNSSISHKIKITLIDCLCRIIINKNQ
jgi:hypothetical protein